MTDIKLDNENLEPCFSFINDSPPNVWGDIITSNFFQRRIENVALLYKNGMTTPKIAKIFNVSTTSICNWLNKAKVKKSKHISSENLSSHYLEEILKDDEKLYSLGRILGYIKSDGCITGSKHTYYAEFSQRYDRGEVLNDFQECFEKVFGISPRKYTAVGSTFKNSYPIASLRAYRKAAVFTLKKFGKFGCYDWDLNFDVEIQNEKFWSSFLQALFEGDGSCAVYVDIYSKTKRRFFINMVVGYSSASDNGIKDLKKILWEKFEITSRIKKEGNHYVLIIASKRNLQKFKENINFISTRKRTSLELGIKYMYEAFQSKEEAEEFLLKLRSAAEDGKIVNLVSTKVRGKQQSKILLLLAETPRTNKELREILQISRKTVHKHLRKMETKGLVKRIGKRGTALVYSATNAQNGVEVV
jgi:transposase